MHSLIIQTTNVRKATWCLPARSVLRSPRCGCVGRLQRHVTSLRNTGCSDRFINLWVANSRSGTMSLTAGGFARGGTNSLVLEKFICSNEYSEWIRLGFREYQDLLKKKLITHSRNYYSHQIMAHHAWIYTLKLQILLLSLKHKYDFTVTTVSGMEKHNKIVKFVFSKDVKATKCMPSKIQGERTIFRFERYFSPGVCWIFWKSTNLFTRINKLMEEMLQY